MLRSSVFQGFLGMLRKGNISYGNIPLNKLPGEIYENLQGYLHKTYNCHRCVKNV